MESRSPLDVYLLSCTTPGWYWVDNRAVDYAALRQQRETDHALRSMERQNGLDSPDDPPPVPGGWMVRAATTLPRPVNPAAIYPDGSLWLEPVSVASNLFNVVLHGTTNGSTYLITSTEALNPQSNIIWLVEGSLQGGTNDTTPFTLGIATRTNSLFIRAQTCDPWCASTALPLAWQWDYFGVTGMNPSAYDDAGFTFLDDWSNGRDPNIIQFSISVARQYVNSSPVPVQLLVSGGVPAGMAVLVDSTNCAAAAWTNVNLNPSV